MPRQILFLGDTSLRTAASYLAGCLHLSGWSFDYVPSDQPLQLDQLSQPYQLLILSDYPAENASEEVQEHLVRQIENGSNLLMIGGWESYRGMGGDWDETAIGELLPIKMANADDRQNCDSPVFLKAQDEHSITANLPWTERPPLIGGYNQVIAKANAEVLLTAERFLANQSGESYSLTHRSSDPLLVIRKTSRSRIGSLMTDLAPHWVGPWVDWGDDRIKAHAPESEGVEVGNLYFQFVTQLVKWVGNF